MATTAAAGGEEGPAGRPDGRWEGALWRGGPSGPALAPVAGMSLFSGGNSHQGRQAFLPLGKEVLFMDVSYVKPRVIGQRSASVVPSSCVPSHDSPP